MVRRTARPWLVLLAGSLVSCSSKDDRPAGVEPGSVGTGGGGVAVGGGSAGAAGTMADAGASADAGSVAVQGSVVEVRAELAGPSPLVVPFSGRAEVVIEAAVGGYLTGTFDGASGETVDLSGSRAGAGVWAGARPLAGSPEVMGGIWPADTLQSLQVQMPVVSRSEIDLVYSVIVSATAADADRAQMVLTFTDSDAAPLAGVSVSAPGTSLVAYRAGGTWSDNVTATDSSGVVAVLNVEALDFPGTLTSVSFTWIGQARAVPVQVARDAVTIAAVAVE